MPEQYCIYLRKSRADAEAEMYGEIDTLARHERTLLEAAKRMKLNVTEIYKEIVSGETIDARPVMQKLLSEVEQRAWAGVLVMEIERLARGDTVDQGIVSQTFKYSGTKIITPVKTYDPDNEFDEEYFEFGLFMSRREYKTINRRLQRGRLSSVKEGNFVGSKPPYGYRRKKLDNEKGYTLEPDPQEAEAVKLIFSMYTSNEYENRSGAWSIAKKLSDLGYPTRSGGKWSYSTVRGILQNPACIGKIQWNRRPRVKKMQDGKMTASRPRNTSDTHVVCDGKHTPIIDEETFYTAQEYLRAGIHPAVPSNRSLQNPLAGLIVCDVCGRNMVRRPYTEGNRTKAKEPSLLCPNPYCVNVSSALRHVETETILSLHKWLDGYNLCIQEDGKKKPPAGDLINTAAKELEETYIFIAKIKKQIANLHDLLEQGIYTTKIFAERSKVLHASLENLDKTKEMLNKKIKESEQFENAKVMLIPKTEHLISIYDTLNDTVTKNALLKEVISRIYYKKTPEAKRNRKKGNNEDFILKIYPRIPDEEITPHM